jgi:hypothetical protein
VGLHDVGVSEVYCNFESCEYLGVANFFRHISMSDKCDEEGGSWNAAVNTHYTPITLGSGQKYEELNGYMRKISIERTMSLRSAH